MPQKQPPLKWYFRSAFLIIAFLGVGPLILPLIWLHPRLSRSTKTVLSVMVILVSGLLIVAMARAIQTVTQYYQLMFQQLQ